MREYKLIHDQIDGVAVIYLIPSGESPPSHAIRFESKEKAHEYKLALGLGTHPDPQRKTEAYTLLKETYAGNPVYEILEARSTVDEVRDPGCCESGCPGCPWTLEQIRLSKLKD
jgi:hypothetical protein